MTKLFTFIVAWIFQTFLPTMKYFKMQAIGLLHGLLNHNQDEHQKQSQATTERKFSIQFGIHIGLWKMDVTNNSI